MEYHDEGPNDAPALLGVHGGFGSGQLLARGFEEHFSSKFPFRLISPSIAGLDASTVNRDADLVEYGKDIEELLDHSNITKFSLMGFSYRGV